MQIKTIESYDGLYQISDNGLVISSPRYLTDISGRIRFTKGGTLTPKTHPDGYYFVSLSKDGIATNKYIHRLVAEAFIPNPECKPIVNHINGVKTDNTVENLEWVTISENVNHAYTIGLSTNIGATHKNAKTITDSCTGKQYHSIKDASEQLCINYSSLRNMLCGANRNTTCLQYSY